MNSQVLPAVRTVGKIINEGHTQTWMGKDYQEYWDRSRQQQSAGGPVTWYLIFNKFLPIRQTLEEIFKLSEKRYLGKESSGHGEESGEFTERTMFILGKLLSACRF